MCFIHSLSVDDCDCPEPCLKRNCDSPGVVELPIPGGNGDTAFYCDFHAEEVRLELMAEAHEDPAEFDVLFDQRKAVAA